MRPCPLAEVQLVLDQFFDPRPSVAMSSCERRGFTPTSRRLLMLAARGVDPDTAVRGTGGECYNHGWSSPVRHRVRIDRVCCVPALQITGLGIGSSQYDAALASVSQRSLPAGRRGREPVGVSPRAVRQGTRTRCGARARRRGGRSSQASTTRQQREDDESRRDGMMNRRQ